MVQESKMELDGYCGCGFRHIPASLRTWIFWIVSDSRIAPVVLKTIPTSCFQLQPYGLKVSPCNYINILDLNQFLFNKHPYFLPAPILILDNLCNFADIYTYIIFFINSYIWIYMYNFINSSINGQLGSFHTYYCE